MKTNAQGIAFYLPQYHPLPENDKHWGTGFTEWNNVVRARRLFPGHHQPHLPADLGFYDLRVPEVRQQQRDLALGAGISAFAMYHYWFQGHRLMHQPVDAFFQDPVDPLRYLLCWANESWTLEWRGQDSVTTLQQEYSREDDVAHAEFLVEKFFLNERYFRYDGRPVFLVYNPHLLPENARMVGVLRDVARVAGVDPLLGGCVAFEERGDVRHQGFDFSVRWAPNWLLIQGAKDPRLEKLLKAQTRALAKRWPRFRHNEAFEYDSVVRQHLAQAKQEWPTCESVFPSWDNTARRPHGDAIIVTRPSPEAFEGWLRRIVGRIRAEDPKLVFINAWNEWAEGCHLEPDDVWGHAWLDASGHVFRTPG
jgi:lipopolysaccharide biosynthesis protein